MKARAGQVYELVAYSESALDFGKVGERRERSVASSWHADAELVALLSSGHRQRVFKVGYVSSFGISSDYSSAAPVIFLHLLRLRALS